MSTWLFLDVDGTVCPQGARDRLAIRTVEFPSHIGAVWAHRSTVEAVRDVPCDKVWLTAWEELAGETFGQDFGFTAHLSEEAYKPGECWTDWWKADALINRVEPYAVHVITNVIWCDDELADPQNQEAIQRVRGQLQEWAVGLQLFAPDPAKGLTSADLGLIRNLADWRQK